ncbi:MAG: hypothetical protein ACTJGD_11890 [Mesonia hippocampi]|uniref:hypothetical protein n=1 Tax=Mesonia hippocampi TaxID=1628250 RepID=UPI003F961F60
MKYILKPFLLIVELIRGLTSNRAITFSLCIMCLRTFRVDKKNVLSTLFETLKSINAVNRYKKKGLKFLNTKKESLNNSKENTLFILGSGPSINEISEQEWDIIRKNTSWGFNFWFCHDFIPSIYIAQNVEGSALGPSYNEELNLLMKKMLADKKELYKNVKFYVRGDGVNNQTFYNSSFGDYLYKNFKNNLYHMAEMPISSKSKVEPKNYLTILKKYGFLKKSNLIQPVPKFGSTIGELIPLALILGFKKIVLCGIDMNGGDHFYDSEEYFKKYPMLKMLSDKNRKKTKHEHMDTTQRTYTVKDVILNLNDFAKENFEAEIYVIKESSTLYPEIKKY